MAAWPGQDAVSLPLAPGLRAALQAAGFTAGDVRACSPGELATGDARALLDPLAMHVTARSLPAPAVAPQPRPSRWRTRTRHWRQPTAGRWRAGTSLVGGAHAVQRLAAVGGSARAAQSAARASACPPTGAASALDLLRGAQHEHRIVTFCAGLDSILGGGVQVRGGTAPGLHAARPYAWCCGRGHSRPTFV